MCDAIHVPRKGEWLGPVLPHNFTLDLDLIRFLTISTNFSPLGVTTNRIRLDSVILMTMVNMMMMTKVNMMMMLTKVNMTTMTCFVCFSPD